MKFFIKKYLALCLALALICSYLPSNLSFALPQISTSGTVTDVEVGLYNQQMTATLVGDNTWEIELSIDAKDKDSIKAEIVDIVMIIDNPLSHQSDIYDIADDASTIVSRLLAEKPKTKVRVALIEARKRANVKEDFISTPISGYQAQRFRLNRAIEKIQSSNDNLGYYGSSKTCVNQAIIEAEKILADSNSYNKNIMIISNGKLSSKDKSDAIASANTARDQGYTVYAVKSESVTTDDETMKALGGGKLYVLPENYQDSNEFTKKLRQMSNNTGPYASNSVAVASTLSDYFDFVKTNNQVDVQVYDENNNELKDKDKLNINIGTYQLRAKDDQGNKINHQNPGFILSIPYMDEDQAPVKIKYLIKAKNNLEAGKDYFVGRTAQFNYNPADDPDDITKYFKIPSVRIGEKKVDITYQTADEKMGVVRLANESSLSASVTENVYDNGTVIGAVAVANTGYQFKNWTDDNNNNIEVSRMAEFKADKDKNGFNVAGAYTANFEKNKAEWFTVTFKDYNDTVLKTEEVVKGSDATPPSDPTRDGYTFEGWDGNYTKVQEDVIVTANFEKIPDVKPTTPASITITFEAGEGGKLLGNDLEDGKLIKTVDSGTAWDSSWVPRYQADEKFEFDTWAPELPEEDAKMTVSAIYKVLFKQKSNNGNTGDGNTGDDNTGDSNTGDDNTGDDNTGDDNTGDDNTGDGNTGDDNTGDDNTGDDNTGDDNTGDSNTGDDNTGDDNTGDDNTGDDNTGDDNTGDDNTGDSNTGDDNTGDDNTGDDNVDADTDDSSNDEAQPPVITTEAETTTEEVTTTTEEETTTTTETEVVTTTTTEEESTTTTTEEETTTTTVVVEDDEDDSDEERAKPESPADEIIEENDTPLGGGEPETTTEVILEENNTPLGSLTETSIEPITTVEIEVVKPDNNGEEEIALDIQVPLGSALPKTNEKNNGLLLLFGGLFSLVGVYLTKRKK